MNWNNLTIDSSWTLFLDRDGVINKKIDNDYVRNWQQFEWITGAKEAISILSGVFGYIFIVTNQQGIGKGLMSEADLLEIHKNMQRDIRKAGGRVDKIYHCAALADSHDPCRKPGIGMAHRAKHDFPETSFEKSMVAGDSVSDMEFGENAGMLRVWIAGSQPGNLSTGQYDFSFPGLIDFANSFS